MAKASKSGTLQVHTTEAANKPKHHDNDEEQTKNASQPGASVAAMSIVPSAAKEKNQDKDDKNRAHNIASRQLLIAPACRRYQLLLHRVSHRVVQAADSVLNLADGLVGLAVALQLGVADSLADGLFRGAFDFLDRTGDSVLVHEWAPCVLRRRVTA